MNDDVLVVGAGPAGASLACRLARAGLRVTIVDRAEFPRDKPCGEFLGPACGPLLADLGFADPVAQLGATRVTGMRLSGFGTAAVGNFRNVGDAAAGQCGFGISRRVLDHALLNAAQSAGASFSPGESFGNLLSDAAGRVVGARTCSRNGSYRDRRARFVVGADGVHSRVARAMGVQRRVPWLDQFALTTHLAGADDDAYAEVLLLPGGFAAATAVGGARTSLNLVLPRAALRQRTTQDWDEFVRRHIAGAPRLAGALAEFGRCTPWRGCGPFAHRTTAPWRPGVALVGDAAGYVDPLTGEGIYYALFGAEALAVALLAACAHPEHEVAAMTEYTRARRRELTPRHRAAAALQRALRHPFLMRAGLGALARWPLLADVVVTLSGDTIHPRQLWRPSFWRALRRVS